MKLSKNLIQSLDFNNILDFLEDELLYPVSIETYDDYLFLEKYEIENYLILVSQMFRFQIEDRFLFLKQTDVREFLKYIEKELVINPQDYLDIANMIENLRNFSSFIDKKTPNELSHLKEKILKLSNNDSLADKKIFKVIDRNANIKSNASNKLFEIRKKIHSIENNIRTTIKDFLTRRDLNKYLQEDFYTIRKNRFVLPIKTSFQGTIKGIIHDRSNSKETVFIEPSEVIVLNNNLIIEKEKEEKEIKKILKEMSIELNREIDNIYNIIDIYVQLDILQAKYKISKKLKGNIVNLSKNVDIKLISVLNPLMILENNKKTKEIDIIMNQNDNILIISGPNAGGKTVALKTLGMISLLLKAGILIPARENSSFPVYSDIFAVIGDNQSIEYKESSFTSHIRDLNKAYKQSKTNDIILIDEILQNTDPASGVALSKAYLDSVNEKNVKALVTTHYSELKYYALEKEHWANASVELDNSNNPTYKLYYNKISQSQALTIAKNLGIEQNILDRAKKHLSNTKNDVSVIIENLNSKISYYENETSKLNKIKKEYANFKKEKSEFMIEKTKFNLEKENLLTEEIEFFKNKLKRKIKSVEKKNIKIQKEELENINKLEKENKENMNKLNNKIDKIDNKEKINLKELKLGQRIFVNSMNKHGIILKISKNELKVEINNISYFVKAKDISKAKSKNEVLINNVKKRIKNQEKEIIDDTMIRRKDNTLDIIGKNTFECDEIIDSFLNRTFYQKKQYTFIIHGHGTGKLRNYVRGFLKKHPLVRSFDKASFEDGGDAVTLVMLNLQ